MNAHKFPWKMATLRLASVLTMTGLALSACGPAATEVPATEAPAATEAPTATLEPFHTATPAPTSTPRPTLTPVADPNPGGLFPVGDYKPFPLPGIITDLTFSADGTFAMMLASGGGPELITSTYVVTGDKIVLNDNPGGGCSGYPGTFTWSFEENTLRLKAFEDTCTQPRAHDLDRQWIKQS